jgi:hypothetical protein
MTPVIIIRAPITRLPATSIIRLATTTGLAITTRLATITRLDTITGTSLLSAAA